MSSILSILISITCTFASNYYAAIEDTTLTSLGAVSMSMSISDNEDLISLTLTGPTSVYYSIGVGSCTMDGAWSLIIPGIDATDGSDPFEQLLGKDSAGYPLDSTFDVTEDTTDGALRTVKFTRSLSTTISDEYYDFTTDDDKLIVMWAYGQGADYANHGEYNRDCTTLSFAKTLQEETKSSFSQHVFQC